MVTVSERAKNGYRKLNMSRNLTETQINDAICSIFDGSRYVSDNDRGILFRNDMLNVELIVKNREIVALYQMRRKSNGHNR